MKLKGHDITVYCWTCGHVMCRHTSGPMFARCGECRSKDVHVITNIDRSEFSRSDFDLMIQRGRGEADPAAR